MALETHIGQSIGKVSGAWVDETGSLAGPTLDDDAMPRFGELRHYLGNERDAALPARDLARDSDQHAGEQLSSVMCQP